MKYQEMMMMMMMMMINEISTDYFSPNTVCAVAAGQESNEMFYFIFNEDSQVADFDVMDDFNHLVVKGQTYLSGFYLEKKAETSKGVTYTINKNKTFYFYSESLVYPFVNFQEDYRGKRTLCSYQMMTIVKYFVS